jgi:hypothetical protein
MMGKARQKWQPEAPMTRKVIPETTQTSIFLKSRRHSCLCFWLSSLIWPRRVSQPSHEHRRERQFATLLRNLQVKPGAA